MKKICRVCGQEFEATNGRQQDCRRPIRKICAICGQEFDDICAQNSTGTTCSPACRNKYASLQRQKAHMKQTKICELCGEEFHPRSNTQKVCERQHTRKCEICRKEFDLQYKSSTGQVDLRKTCSDECLSKFRSIYNPFKDPEIQKKMEETMLAKYGVRRAAQSEVFRNKAKQTMQERYGVEHPSQSEQFKQQTIETNLQRYGTEYPMQNKDIQDKNKATLFDHYGVTNPMESEEIKDRLWDSYKEKTGYDYPMQNPEVKEKSKKFYRENYGVDHVSQTEEFKIKFKETSQERFGTDNPAQNSEVRAKIEATNLEKYGATSYLGSEEGIEATKQRMKTLYGKENIAQTEEWKLAIMKECTNIEEWMKFVEDVEGYISLHYQEEKPTYKQLADRLGVRISTVADCIERNKFNHLIKFSQSYMEQEVSELLDSLRINYQMHNRSVIAPNELDIYIPDYRLAIECNPTATHNSSFGYMNIDNNIIDYSYHKKKTDLCESQGVFLFHIFGYDWKHHKPVIESMLRNLLQKNDIVIYARKCEVKEVNWQDSLEFLKTNHRQGASSASIRLGLYYNNELVSLMTFNKMRTTIGTGSEDLTDCWELARFCSKLNTSVVGAASKLFKHFVTEYTPQRIRSFSDRAHTKGTLYSNLGFKEVRRSDPGYMWVDTKTDVAYNRVNAQKQNIKKFLHDDDIDLALTEREIMESHGFARVYDSGTITWEWTLQK